MSHALVVLFYGEAVCQVLSNMIQSVFRLVLSSGEIQAGLAKRVGHGLREFQQSLRSNWWNNWRGGALALPKTGCITSQSLAHVRPSINRA